MTLKGKKITVHDMTLRDGMHPKRHQMTLDQMIASAILAVRDTQKREQDIRFAPYTLLATGIGAGAALMAAMTTLAAFLLKWLER